MAQGAAVTRVLAAHQPNYLPYLGFIHKAAHADVFVVQDDLKYIKNDFGNRNRVQSGDDWRWLTIPLHADNSSLFATATAAEPNWGAKHSNILRSKYLRARHAEALAPLVDLIATQDATILSEINLAVTRALLSTFGLDVPLVVQSELALGAFSNPNDRLIALCERFDCDVYLSGVGGRAYIDEERWSAAGIRLEWSTYEPVPYDRGSAPWLPNLSALDAVAHERDLVRLIA
jgi:hypothetical protein